MSLLFSDTLDLAQYTSHLHSLYGFYRPLDRLLQERGSALARPRAPLLQSDLEHLGEDATIAPLATPADLPSLPDEAAVCGCLYVVHGASLGGQVIRHRLIAQLGDSVAGALAFYSGDGKGTAATWRDFLAALEERIPPSGPQGDATVAAARATFAKMEAWLTKSATLEASRTKSAARNP